MPDGLQLDIARLFRGHAAVAAIVVAVITDSSAVGGLGVGYIDLSDGYDEIEGRLVEPTDAVFYRLGPPLVVELGVPQLGLGRFENLWCIPIRGRRRGKRQRSGECHVMAIEFCFAVAAVASLVVASDIAIEPRFDLSVLCLFFGQPIG